ncbi:TTC28 [Branchiostoma lanceolatum]|uniref:TTC28 protein n=1 Tax=Branchiostoma lanceolatum TaxID=7740 RepID=A0A8K0ESE9_BRALA|nr:TTC28 [Branchiostoma lanceolatum]
MLQAVNHFTYLGSTASNNLSLDKEIDKRIGKAATTLARLTTRVWENPKLSVKTKMAVYNACVLSTLLYGSETWSTYAKQENRLNAFHMRCMRRILGISWKDKVTNTEVLSRPGLPTMFTLLRQRRLRWLGHVRRMEDGRIPKDLLYGELISGKRRTGRPQLRFKDVCKRDLKALDINTEHWEDLASDRSRWRCTLFRQLKSGEVRLMNSAEEKRIRRKELCNRTESAYRSFTKAAGLYQAALDRCEDSDGRETLRHRLKYAEKVKQKERKKSKKRQEIGTSWHEKAGNSLLTHGAHDVIDREDYGSTYKEHLQEGCRALQAGNLDKAEVNFAAALKSVHVKGMQSQDGGDFTKAAALCNAALVRAKTGEKEGIKQTIKKIAQSFLNHVLGIQEAILVDDVENHRSMLMEGRGYVEDDIKRIEQEIDPYSLDDDDPNITEVETKRAEAIKTLFDTIAHQPKTFISGIVDECMDVIGPPPCKYAIVGLGSQATGLVTPYSDLEFAILVEKETKNCVKYFQNLTHYLHLKVINLGETILPAMAIKSLNDFESDNKLDNWFYDSPHGFAFDGAMPAACKTPLGRGKNCLLIRTPQAMTKVLEDDALQMKRSICGEDTAHPDIASLLDNLGSSCRDLGEHRESGSYIEQALYMEYIIYGKDTAHPVIAGSLENLGASWMNLGEHRKAVSYHEQSLKMKRSIYGEETAHPDIASTLNNLGNAWRVIGDYTKAVSYHEQALKMKRCIYGEDTAHPDIALSLNNVGTAWWGLEDYRKAVGYFEQALQMNRSVYCERTAHPDSANSLGNLGAAWYHLGDYKKTISYCEQSITMKRSIYGKDTVHPDIAASFDNLGAAWSDLGDHRKAVSYYEQSLAMKRSVHGDTAHPDFVVQLYNMGNLWIKLTDHRKAASYYEEALKMSRILYGENTAHFHILALLNNLSLAWRELGDYGQAVTYTDQATRMQKMMKR